MFPNDRRRYDSAAPSGRAEQDEMERLDLFNGRKRRRYTPPTSPEPRFAPSGAAPHGFKSGSHRGSMLPPPRQGGGPVRRPSLPPPRADQGRELRSILYSNGFHVPPPFFDSLEARWLELKRQGADAKEAKEIAAARGIEIKNRCAQIHDLKEANERLENLLARSQADIEKQRHVLEEKQRSMAQLKAERLARTEDAQTIKELKKENKELGEHATMVTQLLTFGTQAQNEKRLEMERMSKEIASLRQMVDAKDRTISNMSAQVHAIAGADPTGAISHALEAQAQTTLGMVQSLKGGVIDRDATIKELRAHIVERHAEVEVHKAGVKKTEEALAASNERNAGLESITEDQQALIEQLLKQETYA